jgi:hypothetical protein
MSDVRYPISVWRQLVLVQTDQLPSPGSEHRLLQRPLAALLVRVVRLGHLARELHE